MKIAGDYVFAASRAIVWEALQDPTVLAAVLPGAERLDLIAPNEYEGQLKIKVGPVQGDFTGKVKLQDLEPPVSYKMAIDGRGAQGFVNATASIMLAEEGPSATRMTYDSEAQVGGRIASVGQRLVESSARAIVKQSLDGLDAAMRARATAAETVAAAGGSAAEASAAAAAALAPLEAAKPSQTAFAAGVAKEVAKDLVPPGMRRAIVIAVAIVLALWVIRSVM